MANTAGAVIPAFGIVVEADRSMFGKRTGKLIAKLTGEYGQTIAQAEGTTISDAKAELLKALAQLAANDLHQTYIHCGDGETVLVVYRTFQGWAYDITSAKRTGKTGCHMNVTTRKEAEQNAINHADQSYGGTLQIVR